jgi:hypothetical protein
MVTLEFTLDEAHTIADALRELAERDELILGPVDMEALRTADDKLIQAAGSAEFYREAAMLAQAT